MGKWGRIFILTPLILACFKSYSFTLSNSVAAAYTEDTVSVDVASVSCDNIGLSHQDLLSLIQEAVDNFWNQVGTSRLRLKAGSVKTVSSAFKTEPICAAGTDCTPNSNLVVDSGILIACNQEATYNFSNNAVLALTVPNNIVGRVIKGALILINDRSGNQFINKSRQEQVSVMAHEIGHAIGLGHSPVEDSLMFYKSYSTRQALGLDDMDGVTYLYPIEQPFGCGTINTDQGPNSKWGGLLVIGLLLGMGAVHLTTQLKERSFQKMSEP